MHRNMRLCAAGTICLLIPLASQTTSQERSKLVDTGVIFTAQHLESLVEFNKMGILTAPFWTPSPEQILQLEAHLKTYIWRRRWHPGAKTVVAEFGNYKKQYSGYIKGGKKWIYVNAFCEELWKGDDRWRDSEIIVFDGGPCFFQVHYHPSGSRFDRLYINGPWPF